MCDERRAAYETAKGEFDAEAFQADLVTGRKTIASAYALFPGAPFVVSNLVFYFKMDGAQVMQDYVAANSVFIAKNAAMWGEALR